MSDKEKIKEALEFIERVLKNPPPDQPDGLKRNLKIKMGQFEIVKGILEKKNLTDYEKLVRDISNELTYLYDNEKPTKKDYEMTIQGIKKVIKYPNFVKGIGGYESLLTSIRRRIVLQEERTKSTKKDYEITIQQIKELVDDSEAVIKARKII